MTAAGLVRWRDDGWRGWIDPAAGLDVPACLAAVRAGGRRSRHARTVRMEQAEGPVFVKRYPAPGGWRAARAFRMGSAMAHAGLAAPVVMVVGRRGGEGLLVTRATGGEDVLAAIARRRGEPAAKRALLRRLGREVGRLHAAGFVHGDLVQPNVHLAADRIVFLDNDRTRRSRLLVCLTGRRNLVQLGRFVVPGVTLADRARVLAGYAEVRGLSRRPRRLLAWWVVRKTVARRCTIDAIPPARAWRAGYATLMRSGGPFDPASGRGRP